MYIYLLWVFYNSVRMSQFLEVFGAVWTHSNRSVLENKRGEMRSRAVMPTLVSCLLGEAWTFPSGGWSPQMALWAWLWKREARSWLQLRDWEREWELLSYNVGPPSTALTTTAAMKSVEHFSKTAWLGGAINPTVNNGIKSLLACCDSIRECLVALLVGE